MRKQKSMIKKILFLITFSSLIFLGAKEQINISPTVYQGFIKINKLIEEKKYFQARSDIFKILKTPNISKTEEIITYHVYGNLYMNWQKYDLAIQLFETTIESKLLPKVTEIDTIKLLAQLYLRKNNLKAGSENYEKWLKTTPKNKITTKDYVALAQIFFQIENYKKSVRYINLAIQKTKKKEKKWLEILYISYLKLKNFDKAGKIIVSLLNQEPQNIKYWKILISVFKETKQIEKELVINDIINRLKLIDDEQLIMNLVSFLIKKKLPNIAGSTLENAILQKIVENNLTNSKLLIYLYFSAKNYKKTEELLISSIEKFKLESLAFQLAQLYMNTEKYYESLAIFNRLKKSKKYRGEAYLNSGIIYFYAKKLDKARKEWSQAVKYKKVRKQAQAYLQQININNN
jgi:tetratricopeptide (TPR) repeat protein